MIQLLLEEHSFFQEQLLDEQLHIILRLKVGHQIDVSLILMILCQHLMDAVLEVTEWNHLAQDVAEKGMVESVKSIGLVVQDQFNEVVFLKDLEDFEKW